MASTHQKEVRLGLLGGGFVANFYMQGLKDVPGQEVVIVCSKREDRPEAFARRWGIKEWTDKLDEVVARSDLDLVIIALPNFLHKEAAIKLAKAGRDMICAKPLGRNKEEAKEMLDAVRRAGVFNGYAETEVFHVHLKDIKVAGAHETCALGDGIVNIPGVITALREINYNGYLSIEHEPEYHDPMHDVKRSLSRLREWLRK